VNLAVLTAALNEASSLRQLAENIPSGADLFVVDDGSVDDTEWTARKAGASVIRHCINLGQGYAFISGIKAIVVDSPKKYDYVVYLDADGQHDPSEIPRFVERVSGADLDVVVGSRILGSNYDGAPFFRRTFLPLFSFMINSLTGYTMTDVMCGFRLFRVSALQRVIQIFDHMLEPQYLASEMFIRFSKAGIAVGEVPIDMHDRIRGQSYKGTVRYGWGVLKAIVRALLDRSRNDFVK